MCKKNCPSGWASSSIDCFKPSGYERGAGYPAWAWNTCTNGNSQGALVYPKCSDGFSPFGCCICSPDCPDDTSDKGHIQLERMYNVTITNT